MIRRLIILLLIVGCDVLQEENVYGCTDTTSTNFDADANIFDNSCEYSAISEFTDFETIRGMDEYGNPTEIFGDGVWGGCIEDTLSALSDEIIEDNSENDNQGGIVIAIPVEFALSSPYPNPFINSTTIGVAVPSEALINIYIINESYEIIQTLINENLNAGTHSFLWNAMNDEGSIVEDGYYRVIVNNGSLECFSNLQVTNQLGGTEIEIEENNGLNYWGGAYNDFGHGVIQTADGGYAVFGNQYSADTQQDPILVKFNSSLVFESSTVIGNNNQYINDIKQVNDGGYIAVGSSYNGIDFDVWVVKFNSDLSISWEYILVNDYDNYGNSVEQILTGDYIVSGSSSDGNDFDMILWKINSEGHQIIYGEESDNGINDYGNYAYQTTDGGYMLLGTSNDSIHLIKLDDDGTIDATFGTEGIVIITECNEGIYTQQLDDGSYIVAGNTQTGTGEHSNVYINTISSTGEIATPVILGGVYNDKVTSVRQTADGGFIFTGSKYGQSTMEDIWVVKLTAALTVQWNYTYGGNNNDHGQYITQTYDGGYVVTGSTYSYGNQSEIILLKLDSYGIPETPIGNLNP